MQRLLISNKRRLAHLPQKYAILALRRCVRTHSGPGTDAIGTASVTAAWDAFRNQVRAVARARGVGLADLADAIGYAPSTVRTQLAMHTPPSAALQAALRGWMSGGGLSVAAGSSQAAGGASEARQRGGLARGGGATRLDPAPAPPSGDPTPCSRMCAPSAEFLARGGIVSAAVTRLTWEYTVLRLSDHDWNAQMFALDSYGTHGWELVCVSGGVAYMKRGCA